jgi:hypothetical protein
MIASLMMLNDNRQKIMCALAIAGASFLSALQVPAAAEDDVLQLAINYVFTGRVDPQDAPEIVDRKACIIVLFEPKFRAYVRYYLARFEMDTSHISKIYVGQQINYVLEVEGNDIIVEHLNPEKTVARGFKTAQIALPGQIDQTERALKLIFNDHCRAEKPKLPF